MAKQIELTERVKDLIRKNTGDDSMSFEGLAVFEATAINTRPIRKRGIWEKAQIARSGLVQAAELLENGENIPLQTLHNEGDELPVGRVFHGQVLENSDGHSELRVLFYIDGSQPDLIQRVNNSTIAEVSINMLWEHMMCSECGWDYRSPEATTINFFEQTCGNGHTIGEDGVHLRLTGLEAWNEMSLVGRGGAVDAKIRSRSAARLSAASVEKLAASGVEPEAILLTANFGDPKPMDMKEFMARLEAVSGEKAVATAALETMKTEAAAKDEKITALTARVAELEAEIAASKEATEEGDDATKVAELTAKVTELEGEVATATKFLGDTAKQALVATGTENPEAPETIALSIEAITNSGAKLAQMIVPGGKSAPADKPVTLAAQAPSSDAFKPRKS